jgi:hypothetical protein
MKLGIPLTIDEIEEHKLQLTPSRQSSISNVLSTTATMTTQQGAISKRRKFVADGVFYAELNEFFQRELAEEGYSGVEVRVTPTVTDISTLDTSKETEEENLGI